MNFIRKHWIIVLVVSLIMGVIIKFSFSSFVLTPRVITEIVNGNVLSATHYIIGIEYPAADFISNLLITFSIALLISLAFIRSIENADKERFEGRLLQFQKDTAKDAIASTFERLVGNDFFQIIKADVLGANFHRYGMRWHYDIEYDDVNNTMSLCGQ